MSAVAYFASLVDMVLLRCIFIVSNPAVSVLVFPSYGSLSPPTVSLVRLMSSFCRRTSQQKRAYVTFFPVGTCFRLMKWNVSDPVTLCDPFSFLPTPFIISQIHLLMIFATILVFVYLRD